MKSLPLLPILLFTAGFNSILLAIEPPSPATVEPPPAIDRDEPLAAEFSLARAAQALDSAALHWQKSRSCTACHTMFPYLMARPALARVSPPPSEVRQFFEDIVAGNREAMPNYTCHDVNGAVAIGIAAALAINDRGTSGKLHPRTRQALDQMWMLQRPSGDWEWPFRDTPPLKVNEHYGATLAAIAAGMAPDDYAKTPAATRGLEGIRRYLEATSAVTLHEQAMLLWASRYVSGLLADDQQKETLGQLLAAQRPDGGWSMASLVDNTADPKWRDSGRAAAAQKEPGYGTEYLAYLGPDKLYQSRLDSDGYATGFVLFVARQADVPANDSRLQRGISWLKTHQRASGRWFTPSQAWHSQNLISNAGTAYAVLGLHACGLDGL